MREPHRSMSDKSSYVKAGAPTPSCAASTFTFQARTWFGGPSSTSASVCATWGVEILMGAEYRSSDAVHAPIGRLETDQRSCSLGWSAVARIVDDTGREAISRGLAGGPWSAGAQLT